MVRNRVLSFMSTFGPPKSPQSTTFSGQQEKQYTTESTPSTSSQNVAAVSRDSPPPRTRPDRASSLRPMSMIHTYQPPVMEIAQDTLPELQPIFTFLNSHANKLYQEGYFLKLNDLDTHGRPHADRSWSESFAQLVGTVLSLWDASALDAAGQDGEVAPTFINLSDASIRMIETLPTRSDDVQPLQNVLSISTAGKNRYLLHFNSLHSLTQWTAAIRLAMYENATLQEAYTGSLIAGKGRLLNNIKQIMEKTKFRNEDWARVRFGAGTPWRRCWCVITPPDEKEVQKQQKQMRKKSAYERMTPLKGNIKFYDTKKTKKVTPIATINDSYSAYAIYPQSKPLIDQSTLIKLEGSITIHSKPDITTEGFIFVMPEVHPAISGFEMMLRFLFPVYDVFAMYGRPNRLIADTIDTRSLMFALPQERRYGYLEILDVASLIHEKGSQAWSEREWRKRMKDLTSARMTRMTANGRPRSRASSYRDYRNSLPPSRGIALRYEDGASIRSTPSLHRDDVPPMPPPHTNSAPPGEQFQPPPGVATPKRPKAQHQRSFSETYPGSDPQYRRSQRRPPEQSFTPSRRSQEQSRPSYEAQRSDRVSFEQFQSPMRVYEQGPPPPTHGVPLGIAAQEAQRQMQYELSNGANSRSSSDSERRFNGSVETEPREVRQDMRPSAPPGLVATPPAFSHQPGAKPQKRPGISPDLRRANSRLSVATLQQLAEAGRNSTTGGAAAAGAAAAWRSNSGSGQSSLHFEDQTQRGVNQAASKGWDNADRSPSAEGVLVNAGTNPTSPGTRNVSDGSSQFDPYPPYYKDKPLMNSYDLLSPSNTTSRKASPLSQSIINSPSNAERAVEPERLVSRGSGAGAPVPAPGIVAKHFPPVSPPERPAPTRSNTNHSISRKPVPGRTPTASRSRSPHKNPSPNRHQQSPEPPLPTERPSIDSLHDRYIDEDALAQVLDHTHTMNSESQAGHPSESGSVYDNDSTASPDYASTRKSTETRRSQKSQKSIEKPRRGKLKTVGTVEPEIPQDIRLGDNTFRPTAASDAPTDADIPNFDFGPTHYYDPRQDSRPNTSGTMTQARHETSKSPGRVTPGPHPDLVVEKSRSSIPSPTPGERAPSRNLVTPEPQLNNQVAGEEKRRSMAWSPGTQIGGSPGSRQSITPEQFVQQRAAASRVTPIYAHGRQNSSSPTPPINSRQSSSELPAKGGPNKLQKRNSATVRDMPMRPHSRGPSGLLHSSDHATQLSAREQEHVSKMTGAPLVNMASSKPKDVVAQGSGLVGAISAREKEKKDIKEGLSGQAVQQAIGQRQLPPRHSSYGAPPMQFTAPQAQYTMPGGYPPSPLQHPVYPTGQQQPYQYQQQGWSPQQQHYQYAQPYVQQQQAHWTPPSAGQFVGAPQQLHQQQQQQQLPTHPMYQNPNPAGSPQGGPQYYGYFGNHGR